MDKVARAWGGQSLAYSVKVKNNWTYTSTPLPPECLHGVYRYTLTLAFEVYTVKCLYLLTWTLCCCNFCIILNPLHYHLVPDCNIGPNILHIILRPWRQTRHFLNKSMTTAARISRICCSVSSYILGFDR